MALVGLSGSKRILIGPLIWQTTSFPFASGSGIVTLDGLNEAAMMIGQIETSDGGSHTIDTTGSSSIFWVTGNVTFASASTVKVGIASVDTAAGTPGRAVNVANVITFDVSKTLVGGGGGITANAAQNHVPDAGSKTIANGDLVAVCIQMTARAGTDSVIVANMGAFTDLVPAVTFLSSAGGYSARDGTPNVFITFADGATGWLFGGEVFSILTNRTWNSGSATKEYGQLYSLPFPVDVYGLYAYAQVATNAANVDLVLYSDPLGTPVAERTVAIDANTVSSTGQRRVSVRFSSPYTTTADQLIAAVMKPTTGANVGSVYKTLATAAQRASEPWGANGYGISRASGAFADANSSLDHYYIGLIAGAFNEEAGAAVLGGSVIS